MLSLTEVLLREADEIEELVEDLQGFFSCVGYAGSHTDEGYINMADEDLKSKKNRVIMKRIEDLCGTMPFADNLSDAYRIALTIKGMTPEERVQEAQEAIDLLGPFEEGDVERREAELAEAQAYDL